MPTKNAFGLADRICVVTGGGSGVGRGVAVALAVEGARVAVLDRNEAGARETLDLVTAAGATGIALACDVADKSSIEAACAAVQTQLGDAQVLVNNAGVTGRGPIEDVSLAEWNRLLSINLTGYFLCAQIFGRAMLEKRDGALVHVSSVMADFANPRGAAYSITKAGVRILSRVLAVEWGPSGVRSNCVQPSLVRTPLSEAMYTNPDFLARRTAAVPSRRIGLPEDIAEGVLFLASPRAAYITGTDLYVDGGFVSNLMNLVPR
jgi:NAD(P)-dependent dehydrogenase (short-subunit alcohol dehydrogenase family)